MKKSIVVEFVGLAGVGKTTICKELQQSLLNKNIKCNYINRERIPIHLRLNIKLLVRSTFLLFQTKPRMSRRMLINLRSFYASQIKVAYFKGKTGIHLSDQGIFQSTGSMRKDSKRELIKDIWNEKRIKNTILPDILIIVKSKSDIVAKRRYERDKVNEIKDIEKGQLRMKQTEEEVSYIEKLNKNTFNFLVLINEGKTIDSLVKEVSDFVLAEYKD